MATAWLELPELEMRTWIGDRQVPQRFPLKWAEHPGGWIARLRELVGHLPPVEDEDDEEVPAERELVVQHQPREHRPVRSWPPLREYDPEPVPAALAGLVRPAAPLPAQWQPKTHTVEETPVATKPNVWETMLEHEDLLSPEMIEMAKAELAKMHGEDPLDVPQYVEPSYQHGRPEPSAMDLTAPVDEREEADPGYLEDAAAEEYEPNDPFIPAPEPFDGSQVVFPKKVADPIEFIGPMTDIQEYAERNMKDPEFLGTIVPAPVEYRDEVCEGAPAPGHVNPVPEVTDEEVAAKVEHLETEYQSWECTELSYLKDMLKQGYNPETNWHFKDLNDRQRAALGI